MRMTIDDEKRKELGTYIKSIMLDKGVGFNQLSMKSKISIKPLNEILYGRQQKVNPFYLQKIAVALRIDYKELYRIIGYLNDDDFNEAEALKKDVEELKKKLQECEQKIIVQNNNNQGHIILGNAKIFSENNVDKGLAEEFAELDEKEKEKVLKFIKEFIKK